MSRLNLVYVDDLTRLANKYGSDKGNSHHGRHYYGRVYSSIFENLRNSTVTLLEIGLLRVDVDRRREMNGSVGISTLSPSKAPSLEMWREYFPNAKLLGFDVDNFSNVRIENCQIFQGDMSSRADLEKLVRSIGRPIDIIIDDGSHVSHHQQIAFGVLFQSVSPGGLYIIEDLHWQDSNYEKPDAPKTCDLLKRFQLDRKFNSPFIFPNEREYIENNIKDVSIFDSLQGNGLQANDAIAVIEKKH